MNWSKMKFKDVEKALNSIGFIFVKNEEMGGPPIESNILYFYNPELKEGLYIAIGKIDDQFVFDEYYTTQVHKQFGEGHGMKEDGTWSEVQITDK